MGGKEARNGLMIDFHPQTFHPNFGKGALGGSKGGGRHGLMDFSRILRPQKKIVDFCLKNIDGFGASGGKVTGK